MMMTMMMMMTQGNTHTQPWGAAVLGFEDRGKTYTQEVT